MVVCSVQRARRRAHRLDRAGPPDHRAYSQNIPSRPASAKRARHPRLAWVPIHEHKVHHLVIDHALDGSVSWALSIPARGRDRPVKAPAFPARSCLPRPLPPQPPQPTPIPYRRSRHGATGAARMVQSCMSSNRATPSGRIGVAYDVHPYKIIALNQSGRSAPRMVVGFIHPGPRIAHPPGALN